VDTLQFPVAGTFTWKVLIGVHSSVVDDLGRATGAACWLRDPYRGSTEYADEITVLPEFPSIPQ
jgi:hypothetical protein